MIKKASLHGGMSILDVGCGTGVLEESLTGDGLSVVGLDLTEEMLRLAQRKSLPNVKLLTLGDAERLPLKDDTFDLVFSCYVVKYCRPEKLAAEARRVLRPQGQVLLYDFSSPRGSFALFHAFYVYGVLRVFGLLLKRVDPGMAFTYEALPDIIRRTKWDGSFGATMKDCGFIEVGSRRLSGGVVTAFWGKKA